MSKLSSFIIRRPGATSFAISLPSESKDLNSDAMPTLTKRCVLIDNGNGPEQR
uniref:Uncharacterized protein n=1 Tax=Lotus japonicus TaxID=34305 RepID=I3SP88_LOTJA|nr:unknown [Lotus japonicus]